MKVSIESLTINLEGPTSGFLNVYLRKDGDDYFYTTGKKSYPSHSSAILDHRAPADWKHVGTINVEEYRRFVLNNNDQFKEDLRHHVIAHMDTFLSNAVVRVSDEHTPTPTKAKLLKKRTPAHRPGIPSPQKPAKAPGKPTKGTKAAKPTEGTPKPVKARKSPGKAIKPVKPVKVRKPVARK